MKCRVNFLLQNYLWTIIVFVMAKVAFMLFCREGHPFSFADMYQVVWHGLSLDLSTALYFLIVPFLAVIVSLWYTGRWLFVILRGYFIIISIAFALAFVADTSLYPFWEFKLDASCLQYLETPTEAMASVTTVYLVWRFVALVVATFVIHTSYKVSVRRLKDCSTLPKGLQYAAVRTGVLLLTTPLIVIGIRGGLGESTTNIGQVYYSQNQFLNHAAVNPVFSFLSSIDKSQTYIIRYDYFDDENCKQLTKGIFNTESIGTDTLLNTQRPNILFIIMESCGGQFTEIGGHEEITPYLNQLAKESVYFTQFYANSWRTDRGTVSILSGYPAFPVTSIMKMPEKSRKLPSIAQKLGEAGYENSFFYGGDINFTNMRSYVMSSGYGRITWKSDYSIEQQNTAKWGVRDDIMAASVLEDIQNSKPTTRWMKTWLTLSSHEPWDVPQHTLDDEVYNAFNYLDNCLKTLIESLKHSKQWGNLLVVILPDHGYRYKGINETTSLFSHIPMIWTGGAIKGPCRINKICMQSDLAATLLGQLQIAHSEFTFSRDVMSQTYQYPLAFHTYVDGMTLIDSTGFMSYDLDAKKIIAAEGNETQRQFDLGRALLQLTSNDLADK